MHSLIYYNIARNTNTYTTKLTWIHWFKVDRNGTCKVFCKMRVWEFTAWIAWKSGRKICNSIYTKVGVGILRKVGKGKKILWLTLITTNNSMNIVIEFGSLRTNSLDNFIIQS